jgi:hypothetical protein
MELNWHGDALIQPPTTFEEAVTIYKSLKNLTIDSMAIVEFSLAPITDYCSGTDTILNAISMNNVDQVSIMCQIHCCYQFNFLPSIIILT